MQSTDAIYEEVCKGVSAEYGLPSKSAVGFDPGSKIEPCLRKLREVRLTLDRAYEERGGGYMSTNRSNPSNPTSSFPRSPAAACDAIHPPSSSLGRGRGPRCRCERNISVDKRCDEAKDVNREEATSPCVFPAPRRLTLVCSPSRVVHAVDGGFGA